MFGWHGILICLSNKCGPSSWIDVYDRHIARFCSMPVMMTSAWRQHDVIDSRTCTCGPFASGGAWWMPTFVICVRPFCAISTTMVEMLDSTCANVRAAAPVVFSPSTIVRLGAGDIGGGSYSSWLGVSLAVMLVVLNSSSIESDMLLLEQSAKTRNKNSKNKREPRVIVSIVMTIVSLSVEFARVYIPYWAALCTSDTSQQQRSC